MLLIIKLLRMKLTITNFISRLSKLLLIGLIWLMFSVAEVKADMQVVCPNSDPAHTNTGSSCTITSSETKLFFADDLLFPGMTLSQNLVVQNLDVDESCALSMTVENNPPVETYDLASALWAAIHDASYTYFGQESSGEATALATYADLYNAGSISLGTILPSYTNTFVWLATLDGETVGNEYQGKKTVFDFSLDFSCGVAPILTHSNGGDAGSTSLASPPVCNDPAPSSAPANLIIVSAGTNTVTLSWDPVSPVTHYALIFTRSDGEMYGANDIGNVTSYVINNLAPDAYTFEVMGVNGCMPGDRASVVGTIRGVPVEGRPVGPEGEILGVTADEELPGDREEQINDIFGQVSGVTTCTQLKYFLPWIILIIQAIATLASEYLQKRKHILTKYLVALTIAGISILVFYLLRECDCYTQPSFLAWICKWYWLAALLIAALVRLVGYGFIDEVETE